MNWGPYGNIDKLSENELSTLDNWICANNGAETVKSYLNLSKDEREKIYDYLDKSIIIVNIIRNNQNYILVHSRPQFFPELAKNKSTEWGATYNKIKDYKECMDYMLWKRDEDDTDDPYKRYKEYGFITICGHEPTFGDIEDMRKTRGVLRIDSGCGHKKGNRKLSLYCIEDDSIEYIPEKELPSQDFIDR